MADRRMLTRIGIRTAGGLVGAGIAVVVVAGASLLPLPGFAIGAPQQTVRPVPADQQRVCPGPILALAADAGEATRPTSLGEPTVAAGTDGPEIQTRSLTPDADSAGEAEAPELLSTATPQGATTPPLFAAAQAQVAQTEDLAGLASAACAEPSADTWLVGGSTALGQTSLVLLANPTSVDASVDLTIYAETGPVDAPGATGIVVPAGAQKVVPLAGLAPSAAAPVVRVRTSGGEVVASLQQSYEQGIQPRGVELTGATAAPERQQIITGVTIANLAAVTAGQSGESVGVDFPTVRLLVPGDADADVQIGAVGENGTAAGNSYSQTVKAGNVAEIPLQGLKDGSFTVTVNSSVPVVAAVRTSVIGSKARDFSWFAASRALADKAMYVAPSGPGAMLHLSNPTEADRTVTMTPQSGAAKKITVPAEGGSNLVVAAGRYTLDDAKGLYGSVSMGADGVASSFALNPPGPLAAPIDVYPR
ncbi:DUF5719 family protein [Leifsonia sp. F6_8S_P_1B]|uniref:DUF5719 family protein n=1 Tax=Leifsonia williamsii TaxID=3035919 RepID=A0ABT8KBT6_9MICO|nr:DUF5719 family protein [Leifsonia williamsii]MDN4614443.1 DUF5719 family protein [Leifsonia williamsii]